MRWLGKLCAATLVLAGPAVARADHVMNSLDVTTALGFTPLASAPVSSVAGRGGAVTLSHTDIGDWISAITGIAAPLASPAFTGTPTAPTQPLRDATTKIATDAFVRANGVAWYNLQGYGMVSGGNCGANGTPNAAAWAAAQAAVPGASGGVLYLPAGNYYTNNITLSVNSLNVMGDSAGGTNIIACTGSGYALTITGGNNHLEHISILAPSAVSQNGIQVDAGGTSATDVHIQAVYGSGGSFVTNINFTNTNAINSRWEYIYSNGASFAGLVIGDSSSTTTENVSGNLSNWTMYNNATGVLIYESGGIALDHFEVALSSAGALLTYPSAGQTPFGIRLNDFYADSSSGTAAGIRLWTNGGTLADVWLTNSGAGYGSAVGLDIGGGTYGIQVAGGSFTGNQGIGINVSGGVTGLTISGAEICQNSRSGSGAYSGITLTSASAKDISITGNTIGSCGIPRQQGIANYQAYGVNVFSGVDRYTITGNVFDGNVTGQVLNSSTSANRVICGNTPASGSYCDNNKDITFPPTTVASLPPASSWTLAHATVSDAASPTFGSIVAGGGSVPVHVISDGTHWLVH